MQYKIQEIMSLVDQYGFAVIGVERAKNVRQSMKALAKADAAHTALENKIRELLGEKNAK